MPPAFPLQLDSPLLLVAGISGAVLVSFLLGARRANIPGKSIVLIFLGVTLLSLAAAGPTWPLPKMPAVAVMIDLSPSTRGAGFRDSQILKQRLAELLGDQPYQLIGFASENRALDPAHPITEMPADRTMFSPPPVDDVLLFSDARFDLPGSSPPVFIVLDAGLEDVPDAAVKRLEIHDGILSATIANAGAARSAVFNGTLGESSVPITTGTIVISRPVAHDAKNISVQITGGDPWPENDSMSIPQPAPMNSQMWWIGENPIGKQWRTIAPGALPNDPLEYLQPAIIVLNNQRASDFSPAAMDRLTQYARDLGGSILILGGDKSFAAGGYLGTPLETISPLSSVPPKPAQRWVILVDASGSMAGESWQSASSAVARLLAALPPMDSVQIGQFSGTIHWWSTGKSVEETREENLPPPGDGPHGPTNLEPALVQVAADLDQSLPTQLLLLSDCDARIDDPGAIATRFKTQNIHLSVLAIGHGGGLAKIAQIAAATGGNVIEQSDPRQWLDAAKSLSQSAVGSGIVNLPVIAHFQIAIPDAAVSLWNRAWQKKVATMLASSAAGDVLAASWQVGLGNVTAVAFSPDPATVDALVTRVARRPRDPRLKIAWNPGPKLQVTIDAADETGKFLNDLQFDLKLGDEKSPIPQTAPGHYEIDINSPSRPALAEIIQSGTWLVDEAEIAGRYAPEFDELGNDHEAMRKLADSSGGEIIQPNDHAKLKLRRPREDRKPLTSWFATGGALLLAAGLMLWRRSGI